MEDNSPLRCRLEGLSQEQMDEFLRCIGFRMLWSVAQAKGIGHKHPLNTLRTYLCHDGAPSMDLDDLATEFVFDYLSSRSSLKTSEELFQKWLSALPGANAPGERLGHLVKKNSDR